MATSIKIKGTKKLSEALKRASIEVKQDVGNVVMGTALTLQGNIKKAIRKQGTGTTYYRIFDAETGWTNIYAGDSEGYITSIKGRTNLSPMHTASRQGEAPASDTGRLLSSIQFDVTGPLSATVFSNVKYAAWLEYGTTQMGERPYFRPAAKAIGPIFRKKLVDALGKKTK